VQLAVVSVASTTALARLTVRHSPGQADVLDVDGTYRPVADETVLRPTDLGIATGALHLLAALLEPTTLARALYPQLVRHLGTRSRDGSALILVVTPGVVLLTPPQVPTGSTLMVTARGSALPDDGLHPDVTDVLDLGPYSPHMLAVDARRTDLLDLWERTVGPSSDQNARWLDVLAAAFPLTVVREPTALLSPWNLQPAQRITGSLTDLAVDGVPVRALDLSGLTADAPWQLAPPTWGNPRGRLSDHRALADVVAALAAELGDDPLPHTATTSLGLPLDATLRAAFRADPDTFVDPFDAAAAADLHGWLTEASADGGPGRYLRALRDARPDLVASFPRMPGPDEAAFVAWVHTHAVAEGAPAALVDPALQAVRPRETSSAPRPPGVNVVGFLRGELGIGESARLVLGALQAAHVPVQARSIDDGLASRQRASFDGQGSTSALFDTSIICVNADLTTRVADLADDVVGRSFRIGMWYWEVEDFPASQHSGFDRLDEVWVATDFVRRAVEPHSPVPVRTLPPPLPQAGPSPAVGREDLGWPDRPVFLFVFDFLSTAERKNPWGTVEAFRRAFSPDDGPVLVLKSLNADKRPAEAERLRLATADLPHVLLDERYLEPALRDAMMALADCYVSLHRSEGLGLTIAEAMAWGTPVIATAYSGNLQFMTPENSFLVPWTPVPIGAGAEPYPPDGTWAEPDLDAAAALMRQVIEDPELAARVGARAASDIATAHSPAAAGRRMAARLDDLSGRRRASGRTSILSRLENVARDAVRARR
jgi:glycosyltransferase involved in cell wall biosynthesis